MGTKRLEREWEMLLYESPNISSFFVFLFFSAFWVRERNRKRKGYREKAIKRER